MATLQIIKSINDYFRFILDGDNNTSVIDNAPNATSFGDIFHFKTKNGAVLFGKQNILYSDITYTDETATDFTFASVDAVWIKLIAEGFFDGLGSSGGGGVDRFDNLLDTFDYFGNDSKVPVVDAAQLKLVPTTFYNFNEFIQLEDVSIPSLIDGKIVSVGLVLGVPKLILTDPPAAPVQLVNSIGVFNISDLITHSTPLNYSSGNLVISNDEQGAFTNFDYRPFGISQVWNSVTSSFDFSSLNLGDEVILTINLKNTTTTTNQIAKLSFVLAEGTVDERTVNIVHRHFKNIVTDERIGGTFSFFIDTDNVKNAPAKIIYSGDNLATIKVDSFIPTIIRKGVNVVDINVPADELISADADNALILGTDDKLFVPQSLIPTNIRSTSFISGSGVTINGGDNTKFDINVVGKIVNPDTFAETAIVVNLTAQTVTNIAAQAESFVWVNSSGAVIQSLTPPDPTILDSIIGHWVLVHSNLTNLNTINPFPFYEDGLAVQLGQLLDFIGFRKFPGSNLLSVGTTGSRLTHTGGHVIKRGGGNTSKRPVFDLNGVTDVTFRHRTRLDTETADTQTFDTNNYNPSGSTVSALSANKFTACPVWKFSSSLVRVQYGQTQFDNLPDAIARYNKSGYVFSPNGQRNGILIAWLIFKKGITLTTAVAGTDYIIIDNTLEGTSSSSLVATLNAAYDVSTQPQFNISDTKGSIDFKSDRASNASPVLRGYDNTNTLKWYVNADGTSSFGVQQYKTISGNVTLDDTYHGCIVRILSTANITIPTGLRADFFACFDAIGAVTGTFVESGTTFSSLFGKKLTNNATGIAYTTSTNNFRLNGNFTV